MTLGLNDRAFEHSAFANARSDDDLGESSTEPRKYQYKTLMQVDIFNTYYNESDDICPDFRIYPTAATESLMQSLGLLFRAKSSGFSILYNDRREKGLIKYLRRHGTEIDVGQTECWSKLSFIVALRNPLFVNFTDLPFNLDLTARNVYLSNNMAHLLDSDIVLNEGSYVSSRYANFFEVIPARYAVPFSIDICENSIKANQIIITNLSGETVFDVKKSPSVDMAYLNLSAVPEGRYTICWLEENKIVFQKPVIYTTAYPTPLCFIDLLFSRPTKDAKGIYPVTLNAENASITSVFYHLKFKARDIHWLYWIVSSSQPVENMRIKAEGDSTIHFYGPTRGLIPTGETAWSFVSDRIIPMQERSPLRFKLVDRLNCQCESSCDCKSRMIVNPLPLISSNQVLNATLAGIFPGKTEHDSEKRKYSEVYVYV